MKWILIFTLFTSIAFAETLVISRVDFSCEGLESICNARKSRFTNIAGDYRSTVHLKETLRIMASDGGYQSFSYKVLGEGENYVLDLNVKLKPVVSEIDIGTVDRTIDANLLQFVILKEGDFFEPRKLQESLLALEKQLDALGYPKNKYSYEIIPLENLVRINIRVELGEPLVFKNIKTNSSSSFVNDFLVRKFNSFYKKPFELNKFKLYLDEAQKDLFSYGYYLLNLSFTPIIKDGKVTLDVKVSNDKLFAFDIEGLEFEAKETVLALIKDLLRKYKRTLNESALVAAIKDFYASKALLNVDVSVQKTKFTTMYKEQALLYRIKIHENSKTEMSSLTFSGNVYFSQTEIKRLFKDEAFELASINYYDQEYLNYFADLLRKKYIEKGFVQVKVIGPIKNFSPDKKKVTIDYNIQEGQRAFVKSIKFEGIPPEYESFILDELKNKTDVPFNPVALSEDIKEVARVLQNKGFYFAEVSNVNEEGFVTYNKSGTEVSIRFKVLPGPFIKLNRILLLGNSKTRKKVILKLIHLGPGEVVTPSKTRQIEAALAATGLFNSVTVAPVQHTSKSAVTDLIVKVSEREYGLVEFAPGYRTDIGIKLSGTVSYINIGGMNRAVTLRSQINQRLNYQTFDPRRRRERKQLLEHNTSLIFTQGDIFDSLIDSASSISYQRKRFYSFDADIFRISQTFTRDFSKYLSSSVRYQFETINQFDASKARDNGRFRIGAVTPSLTYDLRNSQTLPTAGSFFNLSTEFANPYFLSQDNKDPTINYYKLVSRNRFYLPFKNGTVALSIVGGVQENLATGLVQNQNGEAVTEGYIPNIKVFRLTGVDIVRGFNDEEINRLENGQDISEVRVENKAYLANFKLEPRYFINDAIVAGVFLDAGRVYVNNLDLGDLRTSAGLTFKILTPVGTLDFDYGIKLLRKRNADGTLEDPGRFHVSIGFF